MPVASDTARAIGILGSLLWATGIARARQCRLELSLDHRLDELAHPIAQADFDRIKPIVEKMDRRLGLRLQGCRVRAIAGHGVVSTGAQTPGLLGFQHPETTPPSIPTTPRTAPLNELEATERVLARYGSGPRARKTASAQTPTPDIEDHAQRVIEASMTAHKEAEAGMSFIITKAQKTELRRLGYSEEQICEMKPEDANRALGLIS